MHCQRRTVRTIIETGSDYLIGVKANQEKLLKRAVNFTRYNSKIDSFLKTEKSRNRYETRICHVYGGFFVYGWEGLQTVIKVERIRRVKRKGEILLQGKTETSYFISSLNAKDFSAKQFSQGVRSHWSIENSLHYVKDVSLKEDSSTVKVKNAPENASLLKNICLNIFRKKGFENIAKARRFLANDVQGIWDLIRSY